MDACSVLGFEEWIYESLDWLLKGRVFTVGSCACFSGNVFNMWAQSGVLRWCSEAESLHCCVCLLSDCSGGKYMFVLVGKLICLRGFCGFLSCFWTICQVRNGLVTAAIAEGARILLFCVSTFWSKSIYVANGTGLVVFLSFDVFLFSLSLSSIWFGSNVLFTAK